MISHAGISDIGNVRERNEDFLTQSLPGDGVALPEKGALFVICDGVGGSGAGDVASREAATMFVKAYYESRKAPSQAMRDAIARANLHVYDLQLNTKTTSRMQTTLSAIALVGKRALIAHVGDSRIYRIRQSPPGAGDSEDLLFRVDQLTEDHSEVQELIRLQIITPEIARHHPRRNIITRSLGSRTVERAHYRSETVELGDTFVLCSDGLWEPVEDNEIGEIALTQSPEDGCRRLIQLALERGSTDNVSVQIVRIDAPIENEPDVAPVTGSFREWIGRLLRKRFPN